MTDKEKYNNLSSFDIYSLSNEELKIAIKQWAEGDLVLEELLWKCYKNGVETKGCHSGAMPYLDIAADRSKDKVKQMIDSVSNIDGFSVLISPDGGNPFSGDVFYKPSIGLVFLKTQYEHEGNAIFKTLSSSLDNNITNSNMSDAIVDLYSFFAGKESELYFRVINDNGVYTFFIESNSMINFDYFNELFTNIGLELKKDYCGVWHFSSNNIDEFGKKLEKVKNTLVSEYNLPLLDKLDERMSFNEMFRFLRRRFVQKYGDDVKYKEFSNGFDKIFHEKEMEMRKNGQKSNDLWSWVVSELKKEESKLNVNKKI